MNNLVLEIGKEVDQIRVIETLRKVTRKLINFFCCKKIDILKKIVSTKIKNLNICLCKILLK